MLHIQINEERNKAKKTTTEMRTVSSIIMMSSLHFDAIVLTHWCIAKRILFYCKFFLLCISFQIQKFIFCIYDRKTNAMNCNLHTWQYRHMLVSHSLHCLSMMGVKIVISSFFFGTKGQSHQQNRGTYIVYRFLNWKLWKFLSFLITKCAYHFSHIKTNMKLGNCICTHSHRILIENDIMTKSDLL